LLYESTAAASFYLTLLGTNAVMLVFRGKEPATAETYASGRMVPTGIGEGKLEETFQQSAATWFCILRRRASQMLTREN
jgi:hypothetical protein